jgi:hypothetical protein
MHMMKRGLIALTLVAAVGGTTGGLLASAASATPTRGPEIVRSTQYSVGTGLAVGPWSGRGVIHNHGIVTQIPSLITDPAGSSRETLADPAGSFTVLVTGGTAGAPNINPTTCAFNVVVRGLGVKVVSGTGAYANAAGHLVARLAIDGTLSRLATGACNPSPTAPSVFQTDNVTAVGHINLHTS